MPRSKTRRLKRLKKERLKEVAILKKENKSLPDDNSKLSQSNDEAVEAAFVEGVNSYIATFLNGEPDYDWAPKFDKVTTAYMAEFPSKNPDLMASKKAELDDTLAKEAVADEAHREGDNQDAP